MVEITISYAQLVAERNGNGRGGVNGDFPPARIQIRDLDFHYGNRQILFGINLDVPENCITALIGPSGCGKSTLLNCIPRMQKTDKNIAHTVRGEIIYKGRNILDDTVDLLAVRRDIGMLAQKPAAYPWLSIYDNVAMGLRFHDRSLSKEKKDLHVRNALQEAALWKEVQDDLQKSGVRLSGGQQQRLSLARQLILKPGIGKVERDVFLFDEPCASLDPESAAYVEATILELRKTHAIVIVTHSMAQSARLADKVVYMEHGRIVEQGTPDHFFVKGSANKRVAAFIEGSSSESGTTAISPSRELPSRRHWWQRGSQPRGHKP
ncbi:MAG TPA: ATP-binding cassette domain-containing protein [Alphaproteobacteria bacterium]|nr:ATP-binding cassette domain-containing protein [Alphaproteobacteria bacterium]